MPAGEPYRDEIVELLEDLHRCAEKDEAQILVLIRQARHNGVTWTDIAKPLGVTRQNARQRFSHLVGERDTPTWRK
jgi:predicted transcriptional regulator